MECYLCKKLFSRSDSLKRHIDTCKTILSNKEIYIIIKNIENEKQQNIKNLEDAMKNIKLENEQLKIENKQLKAEKTALDPELIHNIKQMTNDERNLHDTLIDLFDNKSGVYLGFVNEDIIKFGKTTNIRDRVTNHKKDYNQFHLVYFMENLNNDRLENIIKKHEIIESHRVSLTINDVKHHELIKLHDKLTLTHLKKIVKNESNKLDVVQFINTQKLFNIKNHILN
jgi:hypothetical protein